MSDLIFLEVHGFCCLTPIGVIFPCFQMSAIPSHLVVLSLTDSFIPPYKPRQVTAMWWPMRHLPVWINTISLDWRLLFIMIRPSLSSYNYAKSQDSLVTTTCGNTSRVVTDLKSRLVFPCMSGRGPRVLASVYYLQFCRCSGSFLPMWRRH